MDSLSGAGDNDVKQPVRIKIISMGNAEVGKVELVSTYMLIALLEQLLSYSIEIFELNCNAVCWQTPLFNVANLPPMTCVHLFSQFRPREYYSVLFHVINVLLMLKFVFIAVVNILHSLKHSEWHCATFVFRFFFQFFNTVWWHVKHRSRDAVHLSNQHTTWKNSFMSNPAVHRTWVIWFMQLAWVLTITASKCHEVDKLAVLSKSSHITKGYCVNRLLIFFYLYVWVSYFTTCHNYVTWFGSSQFQHNAHHHRQLTPSQC